MSLVLRKKCQELLDNVALENYHIQVDENTKCLTIVGECGKVMTTISGIRLSRMAPNPKEIELAIELLDQFLTKHAYNFKSFTEAKAAADNEHIPPAAGLDLCECTVEKISYQDYYQLTFKSKYFPATVTVRSTGQVSIAVIPMDAHSEEFGEVASGLSLHEVRTVKNWVLACKSYTDAHTEKSRILNILNSCEI